MSEILIPVAVYVVALLYASVGHGGGSGYIAVLALAGWAANPDTIASTALTLNVLVAGIGVVTWTRAGAMDWGRAGRLVAVSVPAALLGALIDVPVRVYALILAVVLADAARRLWPRTASTDTPVVTVPRARNLYGTGAAVGLLSGVVGVGGGIFVTPIMILRRWAEPRTAAAVTTVFVLVNSLAGITGRAARGAYDPQDVIILAAAAGIGGLLGARYGSREASPARLRILLAIVLSVAAAKMLIVAVGG